MVNRLMHSLCARKRPRAGSLLRRQRAAGLGEWQDVNGTISRLPRLLIRIILLSLLALLKYFERFSQRMRAIVVAAIARFKMLSMCLSNPVPTRGNEYGSSSAGSNFLSWLGLAHLYISSRTEYTKTNSYLFHNLAECTKTNSVGSLAKQCLWKQEDMQEINYLIL